MENERVSPVTVFLVMGSGVLAISFGSILIKLAHDVPPVMIAAYRLVFSSIILIGIMRVKSLPFERMNGREWLGCLFSGIFLALHFITWITSLSYTSVASSVVLVTMNPIFVGLISYIVLKERQSIALVAGIILSVTGSIVLALSDSGLEGLQITDSTALLGDMLALTGALMASLYLIIGSRIRERISLMTYITAVYTISAVVLVVTSLFIGLSFTGYRPESYMYMFLLAVLPQLIGHTSFNWGLKYLKSSMVAVITLGEPVGASVLAYFILGEKVSIGQGIGIALIFAAIVTASRSGGKT
ncbi:DMT family transporter [Limisalsivibrio acetivorans]|uniref:DMT family transporter n=1 Tax=Limisalsivibrio acetivorans TaxID=1304888 RepID=UPI0003B442B9|nr:DMT family transporter [Limisalsivibrio acetivorans]